jgi:hypothetical protein
MPTFNIVLNASVEVRSAITYLATVINCDCRGAVLFLEGLSGRSSARSCSRTDWRCGLHGRQR